MAPISEERSGSVWVDGAAKDGNGSALSILEILNRRLDRVSLLTRRSRAAVAFEESTFSAG